MAYRIEYPGPSPVWEKVKHPWRRYCIVGFLIVAMLLSASIPSGRRLWINFLIPGDEVSTHLAVSKLISGIQQGERIDDVFINFCKGVMHEEV